MADRRWTARIPVELPVDVEPEGEAAGEPGEGAGALRGCRTRDVSLGGAFVALGPGRAPGLRPRQSVDLVFHLAAGAGRPSRHRVRARVVRVGPEGLGAAFTEFDAATFRALQEILRHAHGQPRRTGT